jgi:hypothetical protein
MLQRKSKPGRASGHLVGAALVAASPIAWEFLKGTKPEWFNDYVVSPYGLLTADQPMGLLTQDTPLNGMDEVFTAP